MNSAVRVQLLCLLLCAGVISAPADSQDFIPGAVDSDLETQLTLFDLQTEMLAFADRYLEEIAEASDSAAVNSGNDQTQVEFYEVKVIYASSAVSIATMPDPLRVLREFIVMLALQKWVWSEPGPPWALPEGTDRIYQALSSIESELRALARRVIPQESIDALDSLIDQWIDANPDRTYVAFVRFSELGSADLQRRFSEEQNARGMLAPITQATRELQEARGVSERAIFLANHLPRLIEWQAETFVYNTLDLPEVRSLIDSSARMATFAENLGKELLTAVDKLSEERVAAIEDLESSAGVLLPLAETISVAASSFRDATVIIGELTDVGTESELEIEDIERVIDNMTGLTEGMIVLVQSMIQLTESEPGAVSMERIDQFLGVHERRLFGYLAGLILLAGVVAFAVIAIGFRNLRSH